LYAFIIIKCIYWLGFYNLLFGSNSIVYSQLRTIGFVKNWAFYLYNSTSIKLSYAFIFGAVLLCILPFILKKLYFISDFLLWLLVINLNNKIYPTLSGGDYLLNQFLFFNCFLVFFESSSTLKKMLHNFASIAIVFQICLVYFLSGLAKLNSSEWLNGSAITTILQVQHYSIDIFSNSKQNILSVIINYIVLFYQLFFPLLIWFKKIKLPFLIIGIFMHLFISFIMGLTSFGFIMILGYVYFYDFKSNSFRNIPKN